jgi:hypothetical protein
MDENVVAAARTADPRQQLKVAGQVTKSIDASTTDGASNSLISQLTSNPFFTAVGHLIISRHDNVTKMYRVLA